LEPEPGGAGTYTVSLTQTVGSRQIGASTDRRLIDLVAPGVNVRLPQVEYSQDSTTDYREKSGSSYATAQVTGATALLAQYGTYWNDFYQTHFDGADWAPDALEPLVQKAVLMNSADKIAGRIGMQKTILDSNGNNWDSSVAADIPAPTGTAGAAALNASRESLPLDQQMGTGQLDVKRALQQYAPGEYHPVTTGSLPTQGWDFNTFGTGSEYMDYDLGRLAQNSYISATLTWNRVVNLQESANTRNGRYDSGETFQAAPLADLDLWLHDRTDNVDVWASRSYVQNVEHIFFQLQNNHDYELRVRQFSGQNTTYALAWWAEALRQGAGMVQGTAWTDGDNNGVWGTDEVGREGVYVDLYNANHVWMDSVQTDSAGHYQFANLDAGDYYVEFTKPDGTIFTSEHVGTNAAIDSDVDSDGFSANFTITSSENITLDAGLQPLPAGSVSGRVWDDANGNGIQDTGETSREGVSVDLYDSSNNLIDSTATDADGAYQFNWLPAGQYYVKVGAPLNYGFTTEGAGSDGTLDSDANSSGNSATFTLRTDEQITHVDAGLVVTASSVQGWVWNDADGDGIQGDGETSVPNAEVKLYDSASNLIATTASDEGGRYEFDLLPAGSYYVVFTKPSENSVFSPENQGSDPSIDSDADSNGQTATFTLGSAEIKTHLDAGSRDVPAVTSVEINGGSPVYVDSQGYSWNLSGQNSVVEQILVTFNEPVTLDDGAFSIVNDATAVTVNSGAAPNTLDVYATTAVVSGSGNTQWIVTFSGPGTNALTGGGVGHVIKDGVYKLHTDGSKVHANGYTASATNDTVFWAMFGAVHDNVLSGTTVNIGTGYLGDTNSEVFLDGADYSEFATDYNSLTDSSQPDYDVAMDYDLDGYYDGSTYTAFATSYNAIKDWSF